MQLQLIQTKLKLKRLQKSQGSAPQGSDYGVGAPTQVSPRKRPGQDANIQVPVSPTRMKVEPVVHTSPARVLLGIDKGLRAQDVSLKRARPPTAARAGSLQRTPPRIRSFADRMAEGRAAEDARLQKADRVEKARGAGFGLNRLTQNEATPNMRSHRADSTATDPLQPSLLESARKRIGSSSNTAFSTPSASFSRAIRKPDISDTAPTSRPPPAIPKPPKASKMVKKRADDAETYEQYSCLHLSKRTLADAELSNALSGKELYHLPRLLKEVKGPNYYPPDCEADYVVFGVVAAKSSPHESKVAAKTANSDDAPNKKYMVMTLTDMKWEIELFLFGSAFTRYWKLSVGTVIAVLNPGIFPPRDHLKHSGRFSLKLTSSADEVLELGHSRDLGFCSSVKKDGTTCDQWLDNRTTQHCDFHINLVLDQARSSRMEVNTMFRGLKRGRTASGETPYQKNSKVVDYKPPNKRFAPQGRKDYETGERYYMGPSFASSAVKLLDAADDLRAPERMRRDLADKEKERLLREKLGAVGTGAGAEYMRATDPGPSQRSGSPVRSGMEVEQKMDAASLGLVAKAGDVRLSPVRGRRRAPHEMGEAMGWSGAFKRGLLDTGKGKVNTSEPERGQRRLGSILTPAPGPVGRQRSVSPKKKARFALEKGIREPGRDSLGDAVGKGGGDSSDELDIV